MLEEARERVRARRKELGEAGDLEAGTVKLSCLHLDSDEAAAVEDLICTLLGRSSGSSRCTFSTGSNQDLGRSVLWRSAGN